LVAQTAQHAVNGVTNVETPPFCRLRFIRVLATLSRGGCWRGCRTVWFWGLPRFWGPVFTTHKEGQKADRFAHARLLAQVIGKAACFFVQAS
jgi:hypothetical protein